MEHGPVLRDVDPLAGEHRLDPVAQARLLGQLDEQPDRLVGDPVLRVVEEEADRLGGQALAAAGVLREEVAEVLALQLREVLLERLPRGALAERGGCRRCHLLSPLRRR